MERFNALGVIKNKTVFDEQKLQVFTETIQGLIKKGVWSRSELITLFNFMILEFEHKETGKFLDGRM